MHVAVSKWTAIIRCRQDMELYVFKTCKTVQQLQQGHLSSAGLPKYTYLSHTATMSTNIRQQTGKPLSGNRRQIQCPPPTGLAVTFSPRDNGINVEEM
jgi:hypothetical protein